MGSANKNKTLLHKHWHAGSQGWVHPAFQTPIKPNPNVVRPYERSLSFDNRYLEDNYKPSTFNHITELPYFSIFTQAPVRRKENPLQGSHPFNGPVGPKPTALIRVQVLHSLGVLVAPEPVEEDEDEADSGSDLDSAEIEMSDELSDDPPVSVSTQTEPTEDYKREVYL
ncbi:hypothetical protein BSL78_06112, partial [Apostichopus japonicus]